MQRLYLVVRDTRRGAPKVLESSTDPAVAIRYALGVAKDGAEPVRYLWRRDRGVEARPQRAGGSVAGKSWEEKTAEDSLRPEGVGFRCAAGGMVWVYGREWATHYEVREWGKWCAVRELQCPVEGPGCYANPFVQRDGVWTVTLLEEGPSYSVSARRYYAGEVREEVEEVGALLREACPGGVVLVTPAREVEAAVCESYALSSRILGRAGVPPTPWLLEENAARVREAMERYRVYPRYLGAELEVLAGEGRVEPEVPGMWRRRCRAFLRRRCGPVVMGDYGSDSEKDSDSEGSDWFSSGDECAVLNRRKGVAKK